MTTQPSDRPRSSFVTTVAWVFIVLASFGTLITAMQSVMMFTVFRMGGMQPGPAFDDPALHDMPAMARFLFTHIEFWFMFCFLMSAITLVAAIGLLRRHNWARVLFVVMMVLGVIWNLGAPWLSIGMMPNTELAEADPMFSTMFTIIQVFTFVFAFAVAGVLGWLAWRLCRPGVRAEFTRANSEPPLDT